MGEVRLSIPTVNAMPAEELYVILYMLNLFQNKKPYQVKAISHYAIKHFNEFLQKTRTRK